MLAVGGHILGDFGVECVRMTAGMAGGVGGTEQEVCGALSSGVMIIGGLLGRNSPQEDDAPAFTLATRYRERFLAALGDTQCARLRENVVFAPEGLGSCAALVKRAARILLELFADME